PNIGLGRAIDGIIRGPLESHVTAVLVGLEVPVNDRDHQVSHRLLGARPARLYRAITRAAVAVADVGVVALFFTELDAVAARAGAGLRRRAARLLFTEGRAAVAQLMVTVIAGFAALHDSITAVRLDAGLARVRAVVVRL